MTAKLLMLQGTASSVGKSVLVSALCRVFADEGLRVAPFKAQNMSNNSFVTADGLEIGRAQAEQARAARIAPDVRMNPVLLKPEGNMRSQVVLLGRPAGTLSSRNFLEKRHLWPEVTRALDSLREDYELVIIEGAGSPAEINLRRGDITNMRVARYGGAPVLLVGDIDNGGVFAHLVGTMALLTRTERALVKGFVINKFRGDIELLKPGLEMLERRARRPVLGVMPYIRDLQLAEEDAVALDRRGVTAGVDAGEIKVAVIRLPHISNFDDFDPLEATPGVRVLYAQRAADVEGARLIIIPGTKNTRDDLAWLKAQGFAATIQALHAAGSSVIGVCGGFQMLGECVRDPLGVEGAPGEEAGLGLLPLTTSFVSEKTTRQVRGWVSASTGLLDGINGTAIEGYEIHMGTTEGDGIEPAFLLEAPETSPSFGRLRTGSEGEPEGLLPRRLNAGQRADGAISNDGRVLGTYVHGLFANDELRRGLLANLAGATKTLTEAPAWDPEAGLDRLAKEARANLDIDAIRQIAGL